MWNSFNAFTLCYVTGRPDAINSIFELVSRESWGATELLTRQKLNPSNVEHILVYHTATPECFSPDECIQAVRSLQVRKRVNPIQFFLFEIFYFEFFWFYFCRTKLLNMKNMIFHSTILSAAMAEHMRPEVGQMKANRRFEMILFCLLLLSVRIALDVIAYRC